MRKKMSNQMREGLGMFSKLNSLLAFSTILFALFVIPVQAEWFELPGVVPPSGCSVGVVLSTEQFTSTGFSNVRTAIPNDEIVSGAWVVSNDFIADTSIILPPNCNFGGTIGTRSDLLGMNLMAIRLKPTITSAAEADVREIKFVWDVNANGLWDPLLDVVLQTKPGSQLDTQDGMVFFNGAQNPIAILATTGGAGNNCLVGRPDGAVARGVGPVAATNTRAGVNGCYIAFLTIAVIGDNPTTGTQFGLELEALAGDMPGTTGISSYTFSSGFSSSRNPQASNVRLQMIGGSPSSHTPLQHISNGSGGPESQLSTLQFTGGMAGEGLLTRFRALEINPGTREAIAMAIGLCDGGYLANTNAAILPPIAGAPPTIAGFLASLPCIAGAGTDGFGTGINGATLIFRGPLARYMGTVRMYVDECFPANSPALCAAIGGGATAAVITATDSGGGDGFLFQTGELSEQVTPKYNDQTGEAIAQFGGRQEQILFTGNGNPVANGSDPGCAVIGAVGAPNGACVAVAPGTTPLILIWTVDIDENAPGGLVDVMLGLQNYDDTAQNAAVAGVQPCFVFAGSAPKSPLAPNQLAAGGPGSCGSNFLNSAAEQYSFTVEGPEHPSTPNNLAAFDTNNSCFLDDPEFFAMIDGWVSNQIGDTLFFAGVDSWVSQENICDVVAGNSVISMSLDSVALRSNLATSATTFSVAGHGIERMSVEIFGLNGASISSQESTGTELMWNQTTARGAPVANGTYLYVINVASADGEILSSEVGKLVIIR
jgi:hypothetical protein